MARLIAFSMFTVLTYVIRHFLHSILSHINVTQYTVCFFFNSIQILFPSKFRTKKYIKPVKNTMMVETQQKANACMCFSDNYFLFILEDSLKKLADNRLFSITFKVSIYHIKRMPTQYFIIWVDWSEIGHLMEVLCLIFAHFLYFRQSGRQ